jgi:SAM-dependent methyltransferase
MAKPDPAHFDRHWAIYDRARPPYPEELWQRLRQFELLPRGGNSLELGAGTGQATGRLLAEGMRVTAVEPGPRLAAGLRERFPQVRVLETTAENAVLPDGAFDVAVAATSIHWMDLSVVLPRIHRALAPGGHLLVWRNVFGDPRADTTLFRQRVSEITARRREPRRPEPADVDTDGWVARLESGGLFRSLHVEEFRWDVTLDAGRVRDLFTTFSDWSPSEVAEAERAVIALGGRVVEHYLTPLVVLVRRNDPGTADSSG